MGNKMEENQMIKKSGKRYLGCLGLALSLVCFMPQEKAEAAKADKAITAYKSYVKKDKVKDYAMIDIDQDGVKELITNEMVGNYSEGINVYTYTNRMIKIGEISDGSLVNLSINKKNKTLIGYYASWGCSGYSIFRKQGTRLVEDRNEYLVDEFDDKTYTLLPESKWKYYINDKRVTGAKLTKFKQTVSGTEVKFYVETETKKAMTAYEKHLKGLKLYSQKIYGNSRVKYGFIDIDGDWIPELVLNTENTFGLATTRVIYAYYNGKVKEIDRAGHGRYKYMDKYFYKNLTIRDHEGGWYYKLSKGKAVELAAKETEYNPYTGSEKTVYRVNKKTVSKSTYNSYVKKLKSDAREIWVYDWTKCTKKNIDKIA